MLPDRHLIVPPGHVVRTEYVPVFDCVLSNRARMAVGDVDRAFQKVLQNGDNSMWPCINGAWGIDDNDNVINGDGQRRVFEIRDGRHEWVASVMAGKTHVLVAWIEPVTREQQP